MLYRPDAFDELTATPWSDAGVRADIAEIAAYAEQAFDADELWPGEEQDAWMSPLPLKNLYAGAAGVVWGLDALRGRGLTEVSLDLAAAAERTLALWRADPRFGEDPPRPAASSLLCGETGMLAVLWRLDRNERYADDLHALIAANRGNPAEEVMWGEPGTLLVARMLHAETGDDRWAKAWRESSAALLGRRDEDGMWTQRLHGVPGRSLTPPHGLTGIVGALLDGGELLDGAVRAELTAQAAAALRRAAVVQDGLANWPVGAGRPLLLDDDEIRLQWCVGAPGIVIAASRYLDEDLLLAGAELVWRAGPHGDEKGPCICHGTAGNGYALLKAFERTQDELWLERARRFAVHALEQASRLREHRGRGRHALWTGDVGVALYAADCLAARPRYPIVETWS